MNRLVSGILLIALSLALLGCLNSANEQTPVDTPPVSPNESSTTVEGITYTLSISSTELLAGTEEGVTTSVFNSTESTAQVVAQPRVTLVGDQEDILLYGLPPGARFLMTANYLGAGETFTNTFTFTVPEPGEYTLVFDVYSNETTDMPEVSFHSIDS